jgi:hypothetical protein
MPTVICGHRLIYYKSKQDDIFNIGEILIGTFDKRLSYFKDALKSNLSSVSRKNKKVIIINNINQHITDVAKLSMSIIESEIEKEFSECNEKTKKALQKIEAELVRKYRIFENASFCDLYDTELNFYGLIDKIKTSSFILAGLARLTSLAPAIGGWFIFDPFTGIAVLITMVIINFYIKTGGSDNKKLVDKVTDVMKNSFNGNWEDTEKKKQKAIYLSIKDQFDRIIQRDIENISEEHRKLFNQFLQSIEEKLQAQYNEKQKSETERQMLQRNRVLISGELKFLKNEQVNLQNQLHKLYVNQAVN